MTEKIEEKKTPETPSSDVITSLQNRINDLSAQIASMIEERKTFTGLDKKVYDEDIKLLRAEISELKLEKKAVVKETKESKGGKANESAEEGQGSIGSGIRSLSIFDNE